MENTANLELFAVHTIFSEYAKIIYAYIKRRQEIGTKLCISQLIIIQICNFLDSFFLYYMRWIKPQNISRYCPFHGMPGHKGLYIKTCLISPLGRTGLGRRTGRRFKIGPGGSAPPPGPLPPAPFLLRGKGFRLLQEQGAGQGGEGCPLGRRVVGRPHDVVGGRRPPSVCWRARL